MITTTATAYGIDPAAMASIVRSSPYPSRERTRKPHPYTSLDQGIDLLNGHFYAEHKGFTLNTHCVIHLHAAPGFDGASIRQQRQFITEMMSALRSWFPRNTGHPFVWTYCIERDDTKRLHMHLHTHLRREHHDALRAFLRIKRDLNGLLYGYPVYTTGGLDKPTAYQLAGLRKYVLKGLEPDGVAPDGRPAFLPLETITESGIVDGCRCRLANSISRKARAANGWQDITDLDTLRGLLPTLPGKNWWEDFRKDPKAKGAGHV